MITYHYSASRQATVLLVEDLLMALSPDWPLTMTIAPAKSGGFFVRIATDTSSDDIDEEQVVKFYSETQVNI